MLKLIKSYKGVTVIELLAVLVILGIISAIAFPTIGNLIDNQKEKAAIAERDIILTAAQSYAQYETSSSDLDDTSSLQDIIDANYLTNFSSDIKIYTSAWRGPNTIEDPSLIMFDKNTYVLAASTDDIGTEINGFIVEGSLPIITGTCR